MTIMLLCKETGVLLLLQIVLSFICATFEIPQFILIVKNKTSA
jgi:hypothetical protein